MADQCFVRIPGGWFLMGSEEGQDDERPVHRAWVDAFNLAVYPVTRAQYAAFDPGYRVQPGEEDLPVTGVGFDKAKEYADIIRSLG